MEAFRAGVTVDKCQFDISYFEKDSEFFKISYCIFNTTQKIAQYQYTIDKADKKQV